MLRNTTVHYRDHNSTKLAPVLSQINPLHVLVPCFFNWLYYTSLPLDGLNRCSPVHYEIYYRFWYLVASYTGTKVFWQYTMSICSEDGGSSFHRNDGQRLPDTLWDGPKQLNTTLSFRSSNMEFMFDWNERCVPLQSKRCCELQCSEICYLRNTVVTPVDFPKTCLKLVTR